MAVFAGAYWSQREESRTSAAERIASFLNGVAGSGGDLARWYRTAWSIEAALQVEVRLDAVSIADELEQNRRDLDRAPIPELGYRFDTWNGAGVSFSATIGGWSEHVGNSAVLDLGDEDRGADGHHRTLIEELVRAFDPDHAVITNHDILRRAGTSAPWQAGLFTFHRGGAVVLHTLR